ncbi:AraC family transcriptional regulator [Ferruginivarius sediminum]|uniref:AraC family transcriptional regulator n=1 Tax=Ferruginivarius sediminum TaxID=2661937 RepID=UPI00137A1479|nr:AraC family transcriptional regulator [Ferruginivarius sediminum]
MAAIDDLLSGLDLNVEPFALCDVREGQTLEVSGQKEATVHYALRGRGRLRFSDGSIVDVGPDTLVVCPRGLSQSIKATAGERGATRCVDPKLGLEWLAAGEDGPQVLLACGRIAAAGGALATPFDGLPAPLVEAAGPESALAMTFQVLLNEIATPRLGSRAMAESLMKQWLILLLRRLAERGDDRLPWLKAMADRQLAPAVARMLAQPAEDASLDDLAALSGMSRSSFAARFRQVFGQPPHAFLTEIRLQQAARLLAATALPVKSVAARAGYRSRSYFTRAFKARYGVDPSAWRDGQRSGIRRG